MNRMIFLWMLTAVAAGCLAAGCAAPSYDVEVYLSPKLKDKFQIYPSVEIDVIGANAQLAEYIDTVPVTDYFTPGNSLRDGADRATLHFSEDNSAPKLLSHRNPVWREFGKKSADQIYLLINLPVTENLQGKKDPRKITIPLTSGWFGADRKFFEITPSGLVQLNERPEQIPFQIVEDGKMENGGIR